MRNAIRRILLGIFGPLFDEFERRLSKDIDRKLNPVKILANPYLVGKLLATGRDVVIPKGQPPIETPVPPEDFWRTYGESVEDYLACGQSDTATLLKILGDGGVNPNSLTRVLDLGCAAGRMLRFFPRSANNAEVWGLDIDARRILWCQQHLSPPINFATITTSPHLPFEDNYFDLVYCASVFTHITDLADAWFLEIRRVLRNGGHAYITIHDKHSVELLFTKYRNNELFAGLVKSVEPFYKRHSIQSGDYACFWFGADPKSQVFYDVEDLVGK